jgi:hypothetical protein
LELRPEKGHHHAEWLPDGAVPGTRSAGFPDWLQFLVRRQGYRSLPKGTRRIHTKEMEWPGMSRRNKSNLVSPKPPAKKIMESEERHAFLQMIGLWRIFDLYLCGLTGDTV